MNDPLTITFHPDAPNDHEIAFSVVSAVVSRFDILANFVANRVLTTNEGGRIAELMLTASPQRGSIDIKVRIRVRSDHVKPKRRSAGAGVLADAADVASIAQFLMATVMVIVGANLEQPVSGAQDNAADREAVKVASEFVRECGGQVAEFAQIAKQTGCPSITLKLRDFGPIEIVRDDLQLVEIDGFQDIPRGSGRDRRNVVGRVISEHGMTVGYRGNSYSAYLALIDDEYILLLDARNSEAALPTKRQTKMTIEMIDDPQNVSIYSREILRSPAPVRGVARRTS